MDEIPERTAELMQVLLEDRFLPEDMQEGPASYYTLATYLFQEFDTKGYQSKSYTIDGVPDVLTIYSPINQDEAVFFNFHGRLRCVAIYKGHTFGLFVSHSLDVHVSEITGKLKHQPYPILESLQWNNEQLMSLFTSLTDVEVSEESAPEEIVMAWLSTEGAEARESDVLISEVRYGGEEYVIFTDPLTGTKFLLKKLEGVGLSLSTAFAGNAFKLFCGEFIVSSYHWEVSHKPVHLGELGVMK